MRLGWPHIPDRSVPFLMKRGEATWEFIIIVRYSKWEHGLEKRMATWGNQTAVPRSTATAHPIKCFGRLQIFQVAAFIFYEKLKFLHQIKFLYGGIKHIKLYKNDKPISIAYFWGVLGVGRGVWFFSLQYWSLMH